MTSRVSRKSFNVLFVARYCRKFGMTLYLWHAFKSSISSWLFKSPESSHLFREYMSSKLQNINFTVEQGNVGSLSFLDVKICRKKGKFVTSVYKKPTFSGVFTNYESFILTYQKRGLLHTLLHRSFSICCDCKTKLIIWRLSLSKTITPWVS